MPDIIVKYHTTPLGELILGSFNNKLCLCDWRYRKMRNTIDDRLKEALNTGYREGTSGVIESCIRQLDEYFEGMRKEFHLDLLPIGTDFQKRVWLQLIHIPYGQTLSYHELAVKTGDANANRAVASANGANAISIVIPCHRVIGGDGSLVGYAGGLNAKKKLLELEGAIPEMKQTSLF